MALAEKGAGARPAPLSPVRASRPRDLRGVPAASRAGTGRSTGAGSAEPAASRARSRVRNAVQPMPAGCGKRCWNCYWKQVAQHRIRLNAAGLASPTLAQRFADFGAWLIKETGARKTALNSNRYLEIFQQIGKAWDDIPEYDALLQHFGAAELRRRLLAVRWMEAAGLLVADADTREADSERRRTEATLNRLPAGSQAAVILAGYHATLRARHQVRARPRSGSVRLATFAGRRAPRDGGSRVEACHPTSELLKRSCDSRSGSAGSSEQLRHVPAARVRNRAGVRRKPKRPATVRRSAGRSCCPSCLRCCARQAVPKPSTGAGSASPCSTSTTCPRAGKNAADDDLATDADGITVRVKNQSYWIQVALPVAEARRRRQRPRSLMRTDRLHRSSRPRPQHRSTRLTSARSRHPRYDAPAQ